jgi:hypothetical protein
MSLQWTKNADEALERGRNEHKPVLLDFSAAPM